MQLKPTFHDHPTGLGFQDWMDVLLFQLNPDQSYGSWERDGLSPADKLYLTILAQGHESTFRAIGTTSAPKVILITDQIHGGRIANGHPYWSSDPFYKRLRPFSHSQESRDSLRKILVHGGINPTTLYVTSRIKNHVVKGISQSLWAQELQILRRWSGSRCICLNLLECNNEPGFSHLHQPFLTKGGNNWWAWQRWYRELRRIVSG